MAEEREYRKIVIALTFMNTVLMGIGLGFYLYDRNKMINVSGNVTTRSSLEIYK